MRIKQSCVYTHLMDLFLELKECFKRNLMHHLTLTHQWSFNKAIHFKHSNIFVVEISFRFDGYEEQKIKVEFEILQLSDSEMRIEELTFHHGKDFCYFENDVNIANVSETGLVFFEKCMRKLIDFSKNKVDKFSKTSTNARFYAKNLIHCKKQKCLLEFDEHFITNLMPNYKQATDLLFDLQYFVEKKLQKSVQSFTRVWDKKKWCVLEHQTIETNDKTLTIEIEKRQASSKREYQFCFVPKIWTLTEENEKEYVKFDIAWEGYQIIKELDKLKYFL